MHSVTSYIERKLGLKVNATKTKITTPGNLKYLGFGFYKDKEGYKAMPHKDSRMNPEEDKGTLRQKMEC